MSTYPMTMRLVDLDDALRIRDLTDPASGPHALQLIVDELIAAVTAVWPSAVRRLSSERRIVALADNYDGLGYEADAVTRDARYTRYVDPDRVLRSHSTAMITSALRSLGRDERSGPGVADVLLAGAGICYRRDSVDWQHTGTPHQMDLWRLTRTIGCSVLDLEAMVAAVVAAVLPDREWRLVDATHPYTQHGRQVDVLVNRTWVEVGECGVVEPRVLVEAALDPRVWSGLAMGVGLDRLLMLRKGIPDIRLLRSEDPRVATQMLELEPYRAVSHLPPVSRDVSLAVGAQTDLSAEAIGDRVRHALGIDAEVAESVTVLAVTAYDDLPQTARQRLGMLPGQRNALVRLVLRSLGSSLPDLQANQLRDRVYAALHEGDRHQWAGEVTRG